MSFEEWCEPTGDYPVTLVDMLMVSLLSFFFSHLLKQSGSNHVNFLYNRGTVREALKKNLKGKEGKGYTTHIMGCYLVLMLVVGFVSGIEEYQNY